MSRWMNTRDAAAYCAVSESHFKRNFKLKPRNAFGKKVYDARDLDRFMERLELWDYIDKDSVARLAAVKSGLT